MEDLLASRPSGQWLAWRLPAALALWTGLLSILLMVAPPVRAHGGDLFFTGVSGPYLVRSFAAWNDGWLDYSIELRNLDTNAEIPDAQLRVTAVTPEGTRGPWEALYTGSVYEIVEPAPEEVHWTLQIEIGGALGPAMLSHELNLAPANWTWASAAVAVAFMAALAAHAYVSRRRARARVAESA